MRFHNLLHETQPDSAALNLRGDRFMSAVKRLEDVTKINGAYPQTTIFDGNLYFVSFLPGRHLRADTRPTTVTVVLNCVTDEILHGSLQRGSVASNRWQVRIDHRFDTEIPFLDLSLTGSNCALDKVRDV